MKRYLEDFPDTLKGMNFKTLEESKHLIYVLSEELNLLYVNPIWIHFAKNNGGKDSLLKEIPLGEYITNAFTGNRIKKFYTENYLKVLETGKPWHHEYECSSKEEFREFHQGAYPVKDGKCIIVINTLIVHLPMHQKRLKKFNVSDKRYVDTTGFVTQCSNCKCTQRIEEPEIWDWVPEWVVKTPNNSSHSICPTCFDYYWKI
ncbi:hypothetical protein [uncultured Polaribacter sp.]|uniref:hypothetical protein n=1 Tax=uncultured Polaribacter sp. TaxID=174711 RepID=UPI0030DAAC36|tara:strand:+ start:1133 stop:1741 length:609 start_codon:yes stop_codon:yes gene_type:complete